MRSKVSHFLFIKLRIYVIKWIDTFVKMNIEQVLYSHFCTANRPYLPEFLPPDSENMRPHSSNSIENTTPL